MPYAPEIEALFTLIAAKFPDNETGDITPQMARAALVGILNHLAGGPNFQTSGFKSVRFLTRDDPRFDQASDMALNELDTMLACLGTRCPVEFEGKEYVLVYDGAPRPGGPFSGLQCWRDGRMKYPTPLVPCKWVPEDSDEAATATFRQITAIQPVPAFVLDEVGIFTRLGQEGFYQYKAPAGGTYGVPTSSDDANWREVAPPAPPTAFFVRLSQWAAIGLDSDDAVYSGRRYAVDFGGGKYVELVGTEYGRFPSVGILNGQPVAVNVHTGYAEPLFYEQVSRATLLARFYDTPPLAGKLYAITDRPGGPAVFARFDKITSWVVGGVTPGMLVALGASAQGVAGAVNYDLGADTTTPSGAVYDDTDVRGLIASLQVSKVETWTPGPKSKDILYFVSGSPGPGFYQPKSAIANSTSVSLAYYNLVFGLPTLESLNAKLDTYAVISANNVPTGYTSFTAALAAQPDGGTLQVRGAQANLQYTKNGQLDGIGAAMGLSFLAAGGFPASANAQTAKLVGFNSQGRVVAIAQAASTINKYTFRNMVLEEGGYFEYYAPGVPAGGLVDTLELINCKAYKTVVVGNAFLGDPIVVLRCADGRPVRVIATNCDFQSTVGPIFGGHASAGMQLVYRGNSVLVPAPGRQVQEVHKGTLSSSDLWATADIVVDERPVAATGIDYTIEVAVSTDTTGAVNRAYVLQGGGCTFTLPAAAAIGATLVVRVDETATGLFPISGISGLTLWAGESASFRQTAQGYRVASKTLRAMSAEIQTTNAQQDSFTSNVFTTVPFSQQNSRTGPAALVSLAGHGFVVQRRGLVNVSATVRLVNCESEGFYYLAFQRAGVTLKYGLGPVAKSGADGFSGYQSVINLSENIAVEAGDVLIAPLYPQGVTAQPALYGVADYGVALFRFTELT